MDPEVGMTAHS